MCESMKSRNFVHMNYLWEVTQLAIPYLVVSGFMFIFIFLKHFADCYDFLISVVAFLSVTSKVTRRNEKKTYIVES